MNTLENWKQLTNQITEDWIRNYFETDDEELDLYWIGGNIGEIFEFADYFISFSDVVKCFELNIQRKKFFEWYYYCLENESVISLANFILSPEERNKKEQKSLQDSKERCIFAEETFKKVLGDGTIS